MKSISQKLWNLFQWIEVFIVVSMCAILFLPNLFGINSYVVMSGSMEPEIHTGSLAYVDKSYDGKDVKTNDIIAFKVDDKKMVTHRAMVINKDDKSIRTKGDANQTEDLKSVPFNNVVGKTIYTIPYLGYFIASLNKITSYIIITIIILLNIIITSIVNKEKEDNLNGQ